MRMLARPNALHRVSAHVICLPLQGADVSGLGQTEPTGDNVWRLAYCQQLRHVRRRRGLR